MLKKYLLLTICLLIYLGMFFIPLSSVNDLTLVQSQSAINALLKGTSPYMYHAMMLGVFPFIAAGLVFHVGGMLYSPWREMNHMGAKGLSQQTALKDKLTLIVWVMMSAKISLGVDESIFTIPSLGAWLVFGELMCMYPVMKKLFTVVEGIGLVSAPVTLFLGANIIMLILGDLVNVFSESLTEIGYWLFGLSVIAALVCALLIITFNKLSTKLNVYHASGVTKAIIRAKLPVKINRTSVMPAIYTMFVVMITLSVVDVGTLDPMVVFSDPIYFVIYCALLYSMTLLLNIHGLDPKRVAGNMLSQGVVVSSSKNKQLFKDNVATITKEIRINSLYQSLFLVFLLSVQACWLNTVTIEPVNVLSYVGGIGLVILVNLFTDLVKNHKKLTQY
jgi:preprotein translocase subunit SecY